jgi:hypothetical protein
MAILTQFGFGGRDFHQGAASFCNYADHMRYTHPWCTKSDAPTILLLPSFERGLFDVDCLAHCNDRMSQPAMQALAVSCQSSLRVGVLPPGGLVPLAFFPAQAGLAVLFDTPLLVVVLRVVGAALALHLALQASFVPGIGREFLTERDQIGLSLAWHDRQRGGAYVQADDVGPTFFVLWFDERVAF